MAIIYAESRFVPHHDDDGEYLCDCDGYPDTIGIDPVAEEQAERTGWLDGPQTDHWVDFALNLSYVLIGYSLLSLLEWVVEGINWLRAAPMRLIRLAGGTSAPFAALAVVIVGGIAAASALALVFAN